MRKPKPGAALLAAWATLSGCGAVFGSMGRAEAAGEGLPTALLFAGTDLWRDGGFSYGGVVWSPGGIDREGFTLKTVLGAGTYRFRSGALGGVEVKGAQLTAAILPGWRFVRDRAVVALFAGLDLQHHRLQPDDPDAGLRGSRTGLRAGFELWYEPTPQTMLAADGSVSTIGTSYSARLAYGWRVLKRLYVGPDVQAFAAGENYRQLRAGIHLTGFKTRQYEWSAGFGWSTDSDERSGGYGRLGLLTRR